MKNWKTTIFGLMAALGAAVVGATRTGLIDGSTLPAWVNTVAALCSVLGTAGMGWASSDKSVVDKALVEHSEQIAAVKGDTSRLLNKP